MEPTKEQLLQELETMRAGMKQLANMYICLADSRAELKSENDQLRQEIETLTAIVNK